MNELFHAFATNPPLQSALLSGVLASIASGVIGTYVVVRRITYIAGGIAHCVLGGLGAAYYFQVEWGWTWCDPMLGAIAAALAAALIIGFVSLRAKEREDTVIGALWAIGMAVGVLFIAATRGYAPDLPSLLFGNILMVSRTDLWMTAGLDLLIVGCGLLLFNRFQAVCFDEEFSRLRGLRVEFYYLLLLCLTALTVVVLMKVVGVVMVIALLTLPVAVAGAFAHRLSHMMLLACVLGTILTAGGLALSYLTDMPAGATIIALSGAAYLATAGLQIVRRRSRQ